MTQRYSFIQTHISFYVKAPFTLVILYSLNIKGSQLVQIEKAGHGFYFEERES
jgi:hypothetical protein